MRFLPLSTLLLGACLANESGNLGAVTTGDTSQPGERGSPLVALDAACGSEGAMLEPLARLPRTPYLQQVTTSSAMIGWVSTSPAGEVVEVTTPDGAVVETAAATGEQQRWTHVEGLTPDTIYCYRVMEGDTPLTERIGFRTAPPADTTRPIRVLAFGDSGGGGADQYALLDQMQTVPFELMIHTGDLAYDSGSLAQIESTVFGVYGELFRHIPFYPAPGNHDYETLQGAPFRDVFALPDNGEGTGTEEWYSYDWGPVHFAALDTERPYGPQAAWLDRDLAKTTLPWKIVYLHRPPYSSGEHGSDTALRSALAPVLTKYGVQLVLAGHDHDYERTMPQDGVTYVVTGGGGRGTRPVGSSSFTAFATDVIHDVYFEVERDTLTLHALDAEGTEFDSVVVAR